MPSLIIRGAVITGASLGGTKATPNVRKYTLTANPSKPLLDVLEIEIPDHADSVKTKRKLAATSCVFTPNGGVANVGGEFELKPVAVGPFEIKRLKKESGVAVEVHFSIESHAVGELAIIEAHRERLGGTDGQLKVNYSGVVTADEDEDEDDGNQLSFDDAAGKRDINAVAEAIDSKRRRRGKVTA